MSESSSEANPEILVNGEQEDQQEEEARAEEHECFSPEEVEVKQTQAKVQSVFQQVRNQIRSQVGTRAPKSSILELMQRVKDREDKMAPVNSKGSSEEVEADESKEEVGVKQEELCDAFEKKLEATQKILKDKFEVQISQVRAEMQAYTNQALKDLELKILSQQIHLQSHHPSQESKSPERRQKPSAPPSLASKRGRVLTRTMTTIIPKTCTPVMLGPRAKSETLSSLKGERSGPVLRDPVLSLPGNRLCQSRRPLLPPAQPPMHQCKKTIRSKTKTRTTAGQYP